MNNWAGGVGGEWGAMDKCNCTSVSRPLRHWRFTGTKQWLQVFRQSALIAVVVSGERRNNLSHWHLTAECCVVSSTTLHVPLALYCQDTDRTARLETGGLLAQLHSGTLSGGWMVQVLEGPGNGCGLSESWVWRVGKVRLVIITEKDQHDHYVMIGKCNFQVKL